MQADLLVNWIVHGKPAAVSCEYRHLIPPASVVDSENEEITLSPGAIRDFEIKGGKTTFMLAQFLPIQVNGGEVIACSQMQEQSVLRRFRVIEGPLIPDASFIKQQLLALRVPVTGHVELAGSIEIIFD